MTAVRGTRPLTPRETDVLRYKAQGRSDYDIACALRVTESAVCSTVLRAIRALGARTLDQAIQIHNQPQENTR
ncbi:LuxR C-terminal-related transcriptional regulator [Kitasatospora sp. NPDC088556]|uniref:LuxR C-terminal-related transcriptional regulator n=1 Tax=Kitasatospora sp. NPDC088556 TaxID=3364076 RepID=UPI0038190CFD